MGLDQYFYAKKKEPILPYKERLHPCGAGVQRLYKFENGFGASVIQTPYSYGGDRGLYELAVIKWKKKKDDFELTYNTEITSHVEGYLKPAEVEQLLERIKALSPKHYVKRSW